MRCNLDATFCDFARLSSTDYGVVFRFYTTFNIFSQQPNSITQLKFPRIWKIVYLYSFRYESQAIIQYKGLWWKSAILSDLTIIETTKEPGFTVFSNSQINEVLKKCTKTNTTLQ